MTRGILFLGVPHYGTKVSFLASILSCTAYWRGASTVLLEYMSEGSPALVALDDEFFDLYMQHGNRLHHVYNFLEMRPETIGKLSLGPVS